MIAPAALLLVLAVPDEFAENLARLGAPRAVERAAAERWLQAHLVLERYPDLAAAARAGDAEVRARLARVLSSDARHLPLALALSREKDSGSSALGREAVRASVARTDPRLGEPALREGLESLLRRAAVGSPPRLWHLEDGLTLAEMVEGLEIVGELPLGLTFDARIATRTSRREEGLPSGPWDEVLRHVALALGVEIEVHGLARGRAGENPVGAFLRLTSEAGARSGVDLISEWLLSLAQDGDEPSRTRAACNLASSGFAPAIAWMDHLVRTRADRSALEGLLLAAARGRVAPSLLSPGVFESLLSEAEARAGPRSARILCALANGGCFDGQGGALVPRLLAGFATATSRARWTRLFLIERNGCAAPEATPLLRALVADPSAAADLRLQALFTLATQGTASSEPLRAADVSGLFRLDLDALGFERLGRVLRLFSLAPPFSDPAKIPGNWSDRERLGLIQTWLWRGETEPLSAHLAAWMRALPAQSRTRGETLADDLRPWCARGAAPLLDGALRRAVELAPEQALAIERVRLLLGLVPAPEVKDLLARGRFELEGERSDLALLGALVGYPVPIAAGEDAQQVLLGGLVGALRENRPLRDCGALIAALERAARGLYSAGRDEAADTFSTSVQALSSRSKTELGRWFERGSWPPTLAETHDVSRTLARFEVPSSL